LIESCLHRGRGRAIVTSKTPLQPQKHDFLRPVRHPPLHQAHIPCWRRVPHPRPTVFQQLQPSPRLLCGAQLRSYQRRSNIWATCRQDTEYPVCPSKAEVVRCRQGSCGVVTQVDNGGALDLGDDQGFWARMRVESRNSVACSAVVSIRRILWP
jgi:hypothetical protein